MAQVATPAPITPVIAPNEAKAFIYQHESGNRPDAQNAGGCIGLGQACSGGVKSALLAACPDWATNYSCQNSFWEAYMSRRYGSWADAKAHWEARVPIGGKDVGNWW